MFINRQYQFGFNESYAEFLWYMCDALKWPRMTFREHLDGMKSTNSY